MTDIIYVANTNLLQLQGLKNEQDSSFQNSATVTVTIVDELGANVPNQTWPLTLPYVASSNGNYEERLPSTVTLVGGRCYTAIIDADAGGGLVGHWEIPLKVVVRS